MGRVYRTLVLKYRVEKLPPETAEKVAQLLKLQQEFRRWLWEWARSGGKTPIPKQNPLKYFAEKFLYAANVVDWLVGVRKNSGPRELKPPLVFDAQLRLNNERDVSKGVFVDMPRGEVRIRKWSGQRGNTVVLPLSESATKWIKERVEEGGRLVFAMAWVGRSRRSRAVALYVALVFRRYAEQITPRRLLVIDLNALHNGVVWAVVEEGRVLRKGVLRPDVIKVLQLQQQIARLDALCAQRGAICRQANEAKSRLWRLLRRWEDEAAKKIVQLAMQYKAAIIADVPLDESMRELKEGNYAAEKKAMLNFGRLRRRIRELAEWHGVSYREERLYSTICPLCGGKMEEAPNRRVVCKCGFKAHRDEVPIHWAMKLFKELLPSFSTIAIGIMTAT